MASTERIAKVADFLWATVYETDFRGKPRGRFCLTREQMKKALGERLLDPADIDRLRKAALNKGLTVVDNDDLFACIESSIVKGYRRPPTELFDTLIEQAFPDADGIVDDAEEEE